jgi:hypothetical protein
LGASVDPVEELSEFDDGSDAVLFFLDDDVEDEPEE